MSKVLFYEGFGAAEPAAATRNGKLEVLQTNAFGTEVSGPVSSNVDGAPQVLTKRFAWQSYFDTALLHKAIQPQAQGADIVPSTQDVSPVAGFAVALLPTSQTPVAIRFGGDERGGSQVFILKPGQILRPFGKKRFVGFTWGLPLGWLGGGVASLAVYGNPDAELDFGPGPSPEIVFHRQRVQIWASGARGLADFLSKGNWPTAFPYNFAQRGAGTTTYKQNGTPALVVQPTKTLVRIGGTGGLTLVNATTLQAHVVAADEFDTDSAGAPTGTGSFVEFGVPAVSSGLTDAGQFILSLPEELNRLGTNYGTLGTTRAGFGLVIAPGADATLVNAVADVVRIGRL